jgi:hypothetical protein
MALNFSQTKGKAQKSSVDSYTYADGENTVRIFGGILPRYMYWLKGTNGKPVPVECLAFSRTKEKFDNLEVDHVPNYFPEIKCSWSYSINCIDPKDGKAKVLNLKKKLFGQIMSAAEDLEADPTDPDTGFDIVFKKTKTGSAAFDVEYTLSVLKCKKRALSEEERAVIAAEPDIDSKYPRPTSDEVKAVLERITAGAEEETSGSMAEKEAAQDLA